VTQERPVQPPPSQPAQGELSGPVIAELIAKEVEATRTKAASLQSRGLAVISSSGALVTLLFGLSALATKAQNFTLPANTRLPLYLAVVFLILAASAAIITNAPRSRDAIAISTLRPLLEENLWNAPAIYAQRAVARSQLDVFAGERRINIKMARLLQTAIAFELIGIAGVGWAVIELIAEA
jgi:hypothetical protein